MTALSGAVEAGRIADGITALFDRIDDAALAMIECSNSEFDAANEERIAAVTAAEDIMTGLCAELRVLIVLCEGSLSLDSEPVATALAKARAALSAVAAAEGGDHG